MSVRFMALLALLVPATLWAHSDLNRREAERRATSPWPEPPPIAALPISSLSYRHFAADMMWLAAIQYYGSSRNVADGHYRLLVPFLERVTALDPLFEYAYRFGGVASVGPKGENIEAATRLLKAGMQARPDVWRIPYILGANCLQYNSDKDCMAFGFTAASKIEGSPPWMGLLASRHLSDQNRGTEAFDLLARLAEHTDDPMLRVRVEERLGELKRAADLETLTGAVKRYRAKNGKSACPEQLSELLDDQMTKVPISPTGAPYVLDENCEPKPPGMTELP